MAKAEKTRCSGTWTEARYNSFIKSGIRSLTRKWKPMFDCLAEAKTWKKVNPKTGREAMHYKCAECGNDFPLKEVVVDHIEPIVPTDHHATWDEIIERALVEKDGFQVLCKPCHQPKSNEENAERREFKKRTIDSV